MTQLFRVRRRIGWGDCDPAGIIYTPHAADIAFETFEAWVVAVVGRSWYQFNYDPDPAERKGMPTVRLEVDFINVLAVDTETVCDVHIERIGRTSLTSKVVCHDGAGHTYFTVTIVSVLVAKPAFKPTEIPPDIRDRIEAYQRACGDG